MDITVGINDPQVMADVRAIRLIRKAVGEGIRLRVDANQGWDVNTSVRIMNGAYEECGVEAVEQPLKYWDFDGLAQIRARTQISLMADESLHSPEDALKLAKLEAVDVFNIKLMKSGGLYPALRINAIGEAAGIKCMLGCMLESRLSNAAAALVASQRNITEADIDSYRHFDEKVIGGGFKVENGVMQLPEEPGLGIVLNL